MTFKALMVVIAVVVFLLLFNLYLTWPKHKDEPFHILGKNPERTYEHYTFFGAYMWNLTYILMLP
ncbi:hypothetical protein [Staphylococcus massiliensis]|uniref:Uncharacterized protein n=1 Tax=Staphylococcus massiliensis S46 TaxID=1229783 RepID=K9B1T1_9STAP|nr:hypothetical protein [Staphylococcus massiliensis]EKU47730.1 hypothetical protein C273_06797 [Staphylococcus massiliensis S46]MCG3400473.1 hypothetical protein [Staphylococcus massiliensis]MCG3401494.1 hypothetical protein [Staphylococcus massiliensis]POA01304.1 hypothetical protein CD133_02300 [Staphylococcus massiliensis CCUG 55927]